MSNIIYTKEIPVAVVEYLQTLDIEKAARENLILTIITTGIDPTTGNAKFYYDEYIDFSIKYHLYKEEIQKLYIPKDIVNLNTTWTLDYTSNMMTVQLNEGACCTNGCKC